MIWIAKAGTNDGFRRWRIWRLASGARNIHNGSGYWRVLGISLSRVTNWSRPGDTLRTFCLGGLVHVTWGTWSSGAKYRDWKFAKLRSPIRFINGSAR